MRNIIDPIVIEYLADIPFANRKAISFGLLDKYQDRVPVIIGRNELIRTPPSKKCKYIAHRGTTFGKFIYEFRKHIPTVDSDTALIFFLDDNSLPKCSECIGTIYDKYKDEDGFLYLSYATENVFG